MYIAIAICLLLTIAYTILMAAYKRGWQLQDEFVVPTSFIPSTTISIIIPARNEQANIAACINSILAQEYPASLFEIIVVDDHSTDNTAAIVNGYNNARVRCIDLATHLQEGEKITAFKKKALATGIAQSKNTLIVTTDADCTAQPHWLIHIAAIYEQEHPVMISGPVAFTNNGSTVQVFQSIDFMSMQGITAASHQLKLGNMSNGANLAFSKEAFDRVGGYAGVDHLSSGDDYLLMMKLQKAYPGKLAHLNSKQSIVSTAPQPDWGGFLQQRIRWASKSGKYDDKRLTGILLLVYLFNLSFLGLVIAGIFNHLFWWVVLCMLVWKIVIELYFLIPVATFFNKRKELKPFVWLQPLHISYIILAGFLGFVGVYRWKGRKTK